MYKLGKRSQREYDTVCDSLERLVDELEKSARQDFTIVQGHRTIEEQRANVKKGVSKTAYSRHLLTPSHAIDIYPYVDGKAIVRNRSKQEAIYWNTLIEDVAKAAKKVGVNIDQGANWKWRDCAHIQLHEKFDEIEWPKEVKLLHNELSK